MVKNKSLLLIISILIIAFATSVLAYKWLQGKAGAEKAQKVPVAVAMADLPWGTILDKTNMRVVPFPRQNLPSGYYLDMNALQGRVVISPVKMNEPIIDSRLAPTGITNGGVAAVISPGKRAMAIKVDKVRGIYGFIKPGHRVDVLVSICKNGQFGQNPVTKTVLQNILVLAVGSETDDKDKNKKPSGNPDVVTLEVTPEEAEVLALAAAEGKQLQLALRNYSDTNNITTKGVNIPSMLSTQLLDKEPAKVIRASAPKKKPAPPAPPAPAPEKKINYTTVEVIKGSSIREVQFKGE